MLPAAQCTIPTTSHGCACTAGVRVSGEQKRNSFVASVQFMLAFFPKAHADMCALTFLCVVLLSAGKVFRSVWVAVLGCTRQQEGAKRWRRAQECAAL